MTLFSMKFRQKITRVFGVVFLLGTLAVLSGWLVSAQTKVNKLGSDLSKGQVPALVKNAGQKKALAELLERRRVDLGFERIEMFDPKGDPLASAPATSHGAEEEEIHGVLTSARTEVRSSGREIAHVVVWRNMEAEGAWSLLIGFAAGLLAALIAWPVIVRKLAEEQSA